LLFGGAKKSPLPGPQLITVVASELRQELINLIVVVRSGSIGASQLRSHPAADGTLCLEQKTGSITFHDTFPGGGSGPVVQFRVPVELCGAVFACRHLQWFAEASKPV
jgi:hypothetical protein